MKHFRPALSLTLALTLLTGICAAQLAQKKALTLEAAKQLAAAAEKEAANNKWTMCIVVVITGSARGMTCAVLCNFQ